MGLHSEAEFLALVLHGMEHIDNLRIQHSSNITRNVRNCRWHGKLNVCLGLAITVLVRFTTVYSALWVPSSDLFLVLQSVQHIIKTRRNQIRIIHTKIRNCSAYHVLRPRSECAMVTNTFINETRDKDILQWVFLSWLDMPNYAQHARLGRCTWNDS